MKIIDLQHHKDKTKEDVENANLESLKAAVGSFMEMVNEGVFRAVALSGIGKDGGCVVFALGQANELEMRGLCDVMRDEIAYAYQEAQE